MDDPTFLGARPAGADATMLAAYLPVPGLGMLPVNAFVIQAAEPVLVDTGLAAFADDFVRALRDVVEPSRLRWIWLTHTDPDHVGGYARVLAEAKRARVVTTFLGAGKLALLGLDASRVHLVEPGQRVDVGDRALVAVRPPSFDAPETIGLVDAKTRALYSADCFGAVLSAPAEDAGDVPPGELRSGFVRWARLDAPWLPLLDGAQLGRALDAIRRLSPSVVLSGHLPPARGLTEALIGNLEAARGQMPEQPEEART